MHIFLLHNDLSSVVNIHHRCRFVCMTPIHWLFTLNRSFLRLFVSCLVCWPHTDFFHVSSTCVTGFVSFAFVVFWLTLNRSLFWFYCIWHCLLTRHWFVQCQQHLYIGVVLQYNFGSMAALWTSHRFNTFIFHFGTVYLVLLHKGCHILYVFGLNSTMCSHIVGTCICQATRSLITLWWMLITL